MIRLLDRHWLITSTTYGTWLPGDVRGFVSPVRDGDGSLVLHNLPGTPYDVDEPMLKRHAEQKLAGDAIWLSRAHASALIPQFRETAGHRKWRLLSAAVMSNHFHVVVTVPGDPSPSRILQDFKAYASRRLNSEWTRPVSETWWTESGSKRKLPDENAVMAAVRYVWNQPGWLARFADPNVSPDWLEPR